MIRGVQGKRVVLQDGIRPAAIRIGDDGRIAEVLGYGALPAAAGFLDAGEAMVLPGLVDTHAHINEPGRTEWEGFETATRAAAAGGITTVVDMPLNSIPPTTTCAALAEKSRAAEGRCLVDYALWGGVIPGNAGELAPLVEAGVPGFKAFLIESGVDEFPYSREADLRTAMPILARLGVPLLAHAELDGPAPAAHRGKERTYAEYLASRPKEWENRAIRALIALSRETGCRVHVVHLSSAEALPAIAAAKREGLKLTVETCPHYLHFHAEEIPDGATHFKCAPPIREKANREALWAGLADGTIDFVVSDHSPCTPGLKLAGTGDFMHAWGGISGLQFGLSVVWTEARSRGHSASELMRWLAAAPAAFAGLSAQKGAIEKGRDADFVLWEPDTEVEVRAEAIWHRHRVTPYAGRKYFGKVRRTVLRGETIFEDGRFPRGPHGRKLIPRKPL